MICLLQPINVISGKPHPPWTILRYFYLVCLPVSGKRLDARFDGGQLSSDGGIVLLRQVEQRLGVADRLAACIKDPRAPDMITHSLADIIRFRLMMIAAGYEDGNDAASLRVDPMFKMALDLAPSDRALCSQPTISRLENLPDTRALLRILAHCDAVWEGGNHPI